MVFRILSKKGFINKIIIIILAFTYRTAIFSYRTEWKLHVNEQTASFTQAHDWSENMCTCTCRAMNVILRANMDAWHHTIAQSVYNIKTHTRIFSLHCLSQDYYKKKKAVQFFVRGICDWFIKKGDNRVDRKGPIRKYKRNTLL